MTSTRNQTVSRSRHQTDRAVVRLRPGGGGSEMTFDDLPVAVGFGSPVEVRPRRLTAVPGVPVDLDGLPASRPPGRVISLPVVDPTGDDRLNDPTRGEPCSARPDTRPSGDSCESEPVPLRLTARGRAVLLVVAAGIGLAVVVAAWFGASSPTPPARSAQPTHVVVHNGDTLWSIASRIAPGRDPRSVVDQLLRVNHLDTATLVPGQTLRTP